MNLKLLALFSVLTTAGSGYAADPGLVGLSLDCQVRTMEGGKEFGSLVVGHGMRLSFQAAGPEHVQPVLVSLNVDGSVARDFRLPVMKVQTDEVFNGFYSYLTHQAYSPYGHSLSVTSISGSLPHFTLSRVDHLLLHGQAVSESIALECLPEL